MRLVAFLGQFGPPQPVREPSGFRQVLPIVGPWVVVGSALVFVVVALVGLRRVRATGHAESERRAAAADAMAAIAELSAELLATDRGGAEAAERLATARALYDQAFTASAMSEVSRIAEEGLDLVRPGAGQERSGRRAGASKFEEWTQLLAVGALASGALFVVMILLGMFTDARDPADDISDDALDVAVGLEDDVVHRAPGSSGTLDEDRVRALIGQRPIVVAQVPEYDGRCAEIAEVRTTDLVVAFEIGPDDAFDGVVCFGADYAPFRGFSPEASAGFVSRDARLSSPDQDGVTRTVERIVRAYDVEAARVYGSEPVPSRTLTPPLLPAKGLFVGYFFLIAGMPFLGAVVIAFVRGRGRALAARTQAAHAPADETDVRLNRLADAVLHPAWPTDEHEARRQAELAEKYVLLLRDHEAGDSTEKQLNELEREVTR